MDRLDLYNCVCCGAEIKNISGERLGTEDDWCSMWGGGIVGKIDAPYGSIHDGDMYVIAICDNCVKEKKLRYVGNYLFPEIDK